MSDKYNEGQKAFYDAIYGTPDLILFSDPHPMNEYQALDRMHRASAKVPRWFGWAWLLRELAGLTVAIFLVDWAANYLWPSYGPTNYWFSLPLALSVTYLLERRRRKKVAVPKAVRIYDLKVAAPETIDDYVRDHVRAKHTAAGHMGINLHTPLDNA